MSLYDERTHKLVMVAVEGEAVPREFRVGWEMSLHDSRSGEAFQTQRPLLRHNLSVEAQYSSERALFAAGIRSLCNVPLIVQRKSIGVIGIGSAEEKFYTDYHAELLQEVANQVALAIANMQAYEEIAALKVKLQAENVYLQEEIRSEHNFEEIVGNSAALLRTLADVERVAATDSTVLILGETGTGKELIARAIHDRSTRKKHPLVKVNCGAITAGLVESELFGHVKGAFTGALADREGRFKLAHGGTLFLDEVGELPLETQVKLLRVLQEQEFEPLGSNRTIKVDVRIIAATNRDLETEFKEGKFRSDLFYRLNVFPIHVPPLRERKEDIPLLIAFFMQRFGRRFGKSIEAVPDASLQQMRSYDWPGNLRELQNIVERAAILSMGNVLELEPFLISSSKQNSSTAVRQASQRESVVSSPASSLDEVQKRHIESVLHQAGWVVEGPNGAAKRLNLHPNTLRSRMQKLGIRRPAKHQ
jgi:formate hydrogenlyase transcriptional activator